MFVGQLFEPACCNSPAPMCSLPEKHVYPSRNPLLAARLLPMRGKCFLVIILNRRWIGHLVAVDPGRSEVYNRTTVMRAFPRLRGRANGEPGTALSQTPKLPHHATGRDHRTRSSWLTTHQYQSFILRAEDLYHRMWRRCNSDPPAHEESLRSSTLSRAVTMCEARQISSLLTRISTPRDPKQSFLC